ncbi:hypothetical protein EHS25_002654 [Saitozyma podzolica]|uniref:54S ribosomal protein L28, mitochondrial n=1 Tax=Saitozyma podzolica TaxID=1890683 RepID=A0A427YD49_9TREE|nr:hypothetical protein EHS25_002654 [Saitozyma podzolica]
MPRLAVSSSSATSLSLLSRPSSSRLPALARGYAAPPSQNPHLVVPADSRTDVLRGVLYPRDAYSPSSASPSGAHHPAHLDRLRAVLPSEEAHETIERAWRLFQREKRARRTISLEAKFKAMEEACDELEKMTRSATEGGEGKAPRYLYDRAMARARQTTTEGAKGKKATAESRWLEARIEGLVPREAWVPTETRGKGWKYDWTRPQ